MRQGGQAAALDGEDLEGGQADAVQAVGGPAVAAVGVRERGGVGGPFAGAGQQAGHVDAPRRRAPQCGQRAREHRAGRGTDGGVLRPQQPGRLQRPRHQLRVQQQPVRLEVVPQTGLADRRAHPVEYLLAEGVVVEERASSAGVEGPGGASPTLGCARAGGAPIPEALAGRLRVPAHQDHRTRAHVLLLAHDPGDTVRLVLREGLGRVLQVAVDVTRGRRGHRRREVRQQPGVHREAAHDLQGRRRVLLADRDPALVPGLHNPAAVHVRQVERAAVVSAGRFGAQRLGRLVPDPLRRDVDQLTLRPAQRGELAAEHRAGVEADGVVQPGGLRDRGVPVDHRRPAAVLLRPRVAHRQAELVGLPGGVAVQGVAADPAGGAAVVPLGQTGVTDDQPAAVEDVVADEAVDELPYLGDELLALARHLLDGLGEAVGVLDLAALEVAAVLVLVVAGHAQRVARLHHRHDAAQHARAVGAAVDQVADEDGRAALRVDPVGVAQLAEQRLQFGGAAVDVADDVEGAGEVGQVVEALLGDDRGVLDVLDAPQDVHLAEALALQVPEGTAEFAGVALDDPAGHVRAVAAGRVALGAHRLGHVEHDGYGEYVVALGQVDQLPPCVGLHAGRVHDGATARGEALAGDVVQDVEGVLGGALVVLVVRDEAAAEVGRDDLGRLEVPAGEGGLAGAGGADEHHQGEVGDGQHAPVPCVVHVRYHGHAAFASFGVVRVNTAIWVGGPTSGSSGPTGTNSTP